jgi:hypothetical protein
LDRRTCASITIINVSTILQHVSYSSRIRDSSSKLAGTFTSAVARKDPNQRGCLIHLQSRFFPLQENLLACPHMLFAIREPFLPFFGFACARSFKCKGATYRPRDLSGRKSKGVPHIVAGRRVQMWIAAKKLRSPSPPPLLKGSRLQKTLS